jgi:hypothetical protein
MHTFIAGSPPALPLPLPGPGMQPSMLAPDFVHGFHDFKISLFMYNQTMADQEKPLEWTLFAPD